MSKKEAPYFVCWAQDDMRLVEDLLARLERLLKASRTYEFKKWQSTQIMIGEAWNEEILVALETHRIALLLLSPTFLTRSYIVQEELPRLLRPERLAFPILLTPVDMTRMEMHGLNARQIFATRIGNERRAFSELRADQRDAFAFELYQAIEARLDRAL